MIFFDNNYVELSFKTRLSRQIDSFEWGFKKFKRKIKATSYNIGTKLFYLKKKFQWQSKATKELYDPIRWKNSANYTNTGNRMNSTGKEDLTCDGYIAKNGGIESSIDGKVYTSKTSYMEHIKANGCEIKDYK